jgi:hypothetical protein
MTWCGNGETKSQWNGIKPGKRGGKDIGGLECSTQKGEPENMERKPKRSKRFTYQRQKLVKRKIEPNEKIRT